MTDDSGKFVGLEAVNEALGETLFTSTGTGTYDPDEYKFAKIIGKKHPSIQGPLKRLTAAHRTVIALHLRCMSNRDIATITGFSEAHVGNIIRDPSSQRIIEAHINGMEQELEALAPMAIDAVRRGLVDESAKTRLAAADKFFRATGRYASADNNRETAEDVLARALAQVAKDNAGTLRELSRPAPVTIVGHEREQSVSPPDTAAPIPRSRQLSLVAPSQELPEGESGGEDEA